MSRRGSTRRALATALVAGLLGASAPATVGAVTYPSDARNLVAAAGDGFVILAWDPPLDDGGAPITSYLISNLLQGVVIYQGEIFPTGTRVTLDEDDYVLNTMDNLSFTLGACNTFGCAVHPRVLERAPTLQLEADLEEEGDRRIHVGDDDPDVVDPQHGHCGSLSSRASEPSSRPPRTPRGRRRRGSTA